MDRIPLDKPVLFVSNHPSGFIEPIIMACLFPVELHFLVRGDLFENKLLRGLLLATNQVPIYRFRDGIASLRNNQKTIAKTIELLKQNHSVIIFAEGSTNADWLVRPLQKGMARMAFQCLDQSKDLDLKIVPVGVTFGHVTRTAREVAINVGRPIDVLSYYTPEARKAKEKMEELSKDTQSAISNLTIDLENREEELPVRKLWNQAITESYPNPLPRVLRTENFIEKLKAFAPHKSSNNFLIVKFIVFSFLGLAGFTFWALPVALGYFLTRHFVKQKEFVSAVRAATTAGFATIYSILMLVIFALLFGIYKAVIIMTALTFSGLFALWAYESLHLHLRFSNKIL